MSNAAYAQIGINTAVPIASLDIVAKRNDGSTAEGVLPPRLSGDEIKAGDPQYTENHAGTVIYASAAVRLPSPKTVNITSAGLYYYDGKMWQRMLQGDPKKLNPQFAGDIKNSVQPSDHNGWYLLNGRSVSSLPTTAKTSATGLGFTTSLPDATDRILKTRNGAELLGTQGGNNNMTITRSNLPDINLVGVVSGTAESAGAHSHASDEGGFLLGGTNVGNNGSGHYQGNGESSSWGGVGLMSSTSASGAHIHSLSGIATIPTGGIGAPMDNRSAYLVVNTFIYLGE
ncbi:hypothetical protein ACM46_08725 [Chryseobacterium angstadtii]|uniref:Uncharacterized protein n=1 Tax=Chryseobacterium angstadtii TaxID=558151 RepID=A0A0J7IED6_9FLAO|nr:hypothetical protein ACM46_08725 [Chryseobacterium angstadtii]